MPRLFAVGIVMSIVMAAPGRALAQVTPGGSDAQSRPQTESSPAVSVPPPREAGQNPFLGSVADEQRTPGVLALTLADAIDRGLKHNLAAVTSEQSIRSARGARLRVLSDLLPNLSARMAGTEQQTNLAAFGFGGFPGISPIVGPFSVFDARVFLSQPIVDLKALGLARMESKNIRAAELSYQNARDLVVLVSADLYLQALAGASRIEAAQAQLTTAQALHRLAADLKDAGIVAGIDVLRAQVQLQEQQQRLIMAQNDFAKQKLQLARAIGLPLGQEFTLADQVPYAPLEPLTLDAALEQSFRSRTDFQAAQARVEAAEANRQAAVGEGLPSFHLNADYGDIGPSLGDSHGTFSVAASLRVPIFQGGRVQGKLIEADALLQQRRSELADFRGRIDYEVRTAFLDVKASDEQLQVARSAVDLANQEVTQAQDRFRAGVTGNIEVIQAQESVARASENYIASLFAHNVAKASLARAMGGAEEAAKRFFGGAR